MSDSDSASSSSDSEDLHTTGLIATRSKRSTAGNLYAGLLANLDDEDIQKDLLAEDAADVGDYEGSDKDGDDDEDAFESSSEEEDQGPPKEGEAEDLEGEKVLKRQERAEAKKKRSRQDARLKIPGGMKRAAKRVRLAEGVKESDGAGDGDDTPVAAPKPKKKSERSNWLPTAEDGPVRQSGRRLAVANRQIVHANLSASFARSEKQRRVMQVAAEREKRASLKHAALTQEERLRKCERVERETAKELGRFEEEEAERQRLREEALAAKRRRGVQGSVARLWSGSCVWEGERVKVGRVEHGSLGEEELESIGRPKVVELQDAQEEDAGAQAVGDGMPNAVPPLDASQPAQALTGANDDGQGAAADTSGSWVHGIEQYAAQPDTMPGPSITTDSSGGDAPIGPFVAPSVPTTSAHLAPLTSQALAVQPPQPPIIYHGWPPGASSHPAPPPVPPPPPAPPLIREQAQRTLLMLEDFPELAIAAETTTTTKSSKRSKSLAATSKSSAPDTTNNPETITPTPLQTLLLPSSYPPLTPQQTTYLLTKPRRKAGAETPLPPAPPRARCALTQWEARFRDPKTGVPYADVHAYKALQRALSGGCCWSGTLGAWVGASMGGSLGVGRPAKGVPTGFVAGGVKKEGV